MNLSLYHINLLDRASFAFGQVIPLLVYETPLLDHVRSLSDHMTPFLDHASFALGHARDFLVQEIPLLDHTRFLSDAIFLLDHLNY